MKTTITEKQVEQFNRMLDVLRCISGHRKAATTFMTAEQLRKSDESDFLGYEEVIEMAYENMQGMAKDVVRGIKPIAVSQEKNHKQDQQLQPPSWPDSPF